MWASQLGNFDGGAIKLSQLYPLPASACLEDELPRLFALASLWALEHKARVLGFELGWTTGQELIHSSTVSYIYNVLVSTPVFIKGMNRSQIA